MSSRLTPDLAARLARIALGHVGREYPNKLDHVLDGDADAQGPRALHPVFYGSFDWHSCVHSYWMLARLRRRVPDGEAATAITARFEEAFTEEAVAGELAYLDRPSARGFERPYGWAWLLKLQAELEEADAPLAARMRPLASAFADRFKAFLPLADYPVRAGVHTNTAFALRLALDYAEAVADAELAALIRDRALAWYARGRSAPAWEPSGDDFLSPTLVEAQLMARILSSPPSSEPERSVEPGPNRAAPSGMTGEAWLAAYLPQAAAGRPETLFTPAAVSDRSDGKIAHLDGLNLSRAWGWRELAPHLEPEAAARARAAADLHLDASLPHVGGDYMGEHWLASYAVLALEAA